ncbi:hypothetical protein EG327_009566 [Venturia inaequalis]|uniref:Zn(2)-C6 fungal-type domain-containing protein n=1 Tax=Venturia inaequalis TaxID=5025 RepID=A0A8H3UKC6_VENIN|nr:hypothetical protein EG327_009566 [Venturia inaequalis]
MNSNLPQQKLGRSSSGHGSLPPKIRRRNRLITSCLECRRRKLKCDKQHPCSNCTKFVRDCVFLAPALDPAAQLKLAEIKEKMGSLERTLEDDVARRRGGYDSTNDSGGEQLPGLGHESSAEDEAPEPDNERGLEPTPLAFTDAAYYEDADDDVLDLGVTIGKMRLTERIGGFVRPKFSQEITFVLNEVPSFSSDQKPITPTSVLGHEDIIRPGKDFLAPSSSFFFAAEPQHWDLMSYLPSQQVADSLLNQYWNCVHYMCRVLHRPTFERQYISFWQQVQGGIEPPASLQALVFSVLLSATISLDEEQIAMQFGVEKKQLIESFQQGTESALYRANFIRTTKLQTLQALVMYLIPLCRTEVTRAHSALAGTAIRLAECMGLHRDGTHYGLSPVEVHVRRMIWYQLCFLDIRTCEATGPRPQIRREDFDTRYPLNVNDIDLESDNPPTEDAPHWTDMTFSRMRFEINEMHRYTWMERPRLERKKTTLTAVLSKVQHFIACTDKKYLPMLDKNQPLHNMALLVYKLTTLRIHVMFLHRYSSNHARKMPERLRKIVLTSGVQQVECAIMIETIPSLKPWSWYLGALHQYHTALLLLAEEYATDVRHHEDRIWKCLDYVFELPNHLTRREKARLVLSEVAQKTEIYHNLRRTRAPKDVEDKMGPSSNTILAHGQLSPSASPPPTSVHNVGRMAGHAEYRTFRPNITDQVYYAPVNTNPMLAQFSPHSTNSNASFHEQRRRGESFGSTTSPGMADVDWIYPCIMAAMSGTNSSLQKQTFKILVTSKTSNFRRILSIRANNNSIINSTPNNSSYRPSIFTIIKVITHIQTPRFDDLTQKFRTPNDL